MQPDQLRERAEALQRAYAVATIMSAPRERIGLWLRMSAERLSRLLHLDLHYPGETAPRSECRPLSLTLSLSRAQLPPTSRPSQLPLPLPLMASTCCRGRRLARESQRRHVPSHARRRVPPPLQGPAPPRSEGEGPAGTGARSSPALTRRPAGRQKPVRVGARRVRGARPGVPGCRRVRCRPREAAGHAAGPGTPVLRGAGPAAEAADRVGQGPFMSPARANRCPPNPICEYTVSAGEVPVWR